MERMEPCCGLSNITGAIIIGIIQIILCSILCAAYAMSLGFLAHGRDQMMKELDSEAGRDFVSSLGLNNTNETAVFVIIVSYTVLYSIKIIFAIQLLMAIYLNSLLAIKIWLSLEAFAFLTRIVLFITSIVMVDFTVMAAILIYTFSFLVEFFCIGVVYLLTLDMAKPTWKTRSAFPEGLRIHSRRMYIKEQAFALNKHR